MIHKLLVVSALLLLLAGLGFSFVSENAPSAPARTRVVEASSEAAGPITCYCCSVCKGHPKTCPEKLCCKDVQ